MDNYVRKDMIDRHYAVELRLGRRGITASVNLFLFLVRKSVTTT